MTRWSGGGAGVGVGDNSAVWHTTGGLWQGEAAGRANRGGDNRGVDQIGGAEGVDCGDLIQTVHWQLDLERLHHGLLGLLWLALDLKGLGLGMNPQRL